MYDLSVTGCDFYAGTDWTGTAAHVSNLRYSCCPLVTAYPDGVFHACNFGQGLTWMQGQNGWTFGANDSVELYVR